MPIPKEILNVERPKNTVVIAYGKNKDLYGVRQRIGCKRINGKNHPVNGPTIGHIKDGKYIPIDEINTENKNVSVSKIDLKDWANVTLCDNLFGEIKNELLKVYSNSDALKIYAISILRVCYPGIKNYELKEYYDNSFLSEMYPGIGLSKNIVSKFIQDLGKTFSRIKKFMTNRAEKIAANHNVLIDGTLKTNNSKVNSLSDFSRKSKVKGSKEISVLYTFDLELGEPICSQSYPGNMLDVTAYKDFVKRNNIKEGILVGDKGFQSSAIEDLLEDKPNLHYLNPIKRNSKYINTHNLTEYEGILDGHPTVVYKKEKVNGKNKWLYEFRDSAKAANEEKGWLEKNQKNNTYDISEFKKKQESFGTIVLESDLDMTALEIYKAYSKRWEIELVMKYYKTACEFDETRVQNDYSVIGSEFCDFLSTVLTYKILNKCEKIKELEDIPYKKLLKILERGKKFRGSESDWEMISMNPSQENILKKLGIIK